VKTEYLSVLCGICILLLLAPITEAGFREEADTYYLTARNYFKADDYKNSLRNVHLARDLYVRIQYYRGIGDCDALISQIEGGTTKNLLGGYYYTLASDYFLSKNRSEEILQNSIQFARYGKARYQEAQNNEGVTRCDNIIQRASLELQTMFNTKRMHAENLYNTARTHLINKNHPSALEFAQKASKAFAEISDDVGLSKANTLISTINNEIESARQNAAVTYQTAMDYYGSGDLNNALLYATKAKSLYTSIEDFKGISKSNDLISIIHQARDQDIEEKKRYAARLLKDAEEDLVRGYYENATEKVKTARSIYYDFLGKAQDKPEKKLWEGFIWQCDELLAKINMEWTDDVKKQQADQYFSKAQEFFIGQRINDALSYAEKAKKLYVELENYVGVSKTDSLINTINERFDKEGLAEGNLSLAGYYYSMAEYDNARHHALIAKLIYNNLMGSNKTRDVDEMLKLIEDGEETKVKAREFFDKAYIKYHNSEFKSAKDNAEKAYNLYRQINHSIGVSESASLLDKANEKASAEEMRSRLTILSVLILVILIVILAVNYMKKKRELMEDEDRRRSEQDKKREIDEKMWEVEREEETDKRVKDELKKMIEQERGAIDDKGPPTESQEEGPPAEAPGEAPPAETPKEGGASEAGEDD